MFVCFSRHGANGEAMNSFKQMIKAGVIKRTDTGMFIRYTDIHVKPGFNRRVEDERFKESIDELTAYMAAGGEVPALEVYARDGDTGVDHEGGVWIVEGHRRHRGYGNLLAMGKPVEWIKITPFVGNDAERIARIATSNSQLPLTPLELASVYRELRALNWSSDEIARRMGKKREHVDRILALADANTDVQQLVSDGAVSPTVAVKRVKQHGEKAGEVLAGELEQAKAEGKKRVTDKKPARPLVPELAGVEWKPEGEANTYALVKGGDWVASIRMNGSMLTEKQEAILSAIFPRQVVEHG